MTTSDNTNSPSISLKTRIGWIGTGVMGLSRCNQLLGKGYRVTVYNRTRDKAQPLLAAGATWGESPRTVADKADVIFTLEHRRLC